MRCRSRSLRARAAKNQWRLFGTVLLLHPVGVSAIIRRTLDDLELETHDAPVQEQKHVSVTPTVVYVGGGNRNMTSLTLMSSTLQETVNLTSLTLLSSRLQQTVNLTSLTLLSSRLHEAVNLTSLTLLSPKLLEAVSFPHTATFQAKDGPMVAFATILFVICVIGFLLSIVLPAVSSEDGLSEKTHRARSEISGGPIAPMRLDHSQRSLADGKSARSTPQHKAFRKIDSSDYGRFDSVVDGRSSRLSMESNLSVNSQRIMSASASNAPTQRNITTNGPLFCKELILPNTDAVFCVAFKDLENDSETFDLCGQSGKPLLEANVSNTEEGSSLSVRMKTKGSPVLGTLASATAYTRFPVLSLKDARDNLFGVLKGTGEMKFSLYVGGFEVVRLEFDGETSNVHLLTVSDGSSLAQASRCTENETFKHEEFLQVRVNAGVDCVLCLLCIIGALLFSDHAGDSLQSGSLPLSDSSSD